MKTTLSLDEKLLQRLRQEAARQRKTMSEIVEAALRAFLSRPEKPAEQPDLPSFSSGGAWVDIADREALYGAMEGR